MRRFFSVEFKRDAANFIIQQGYSITEACRAVDVGPTALARWVQQLRDERGYNKAAVGMANKLARIGWVILSQQTAYHSVQ